jgi:hypothetical protein
MKQSPGEKEVGFFAQMVKAKISATRRNNLVTAPTMITIVGLCQPQSEL